MNKNMFVLFILMVWNVYGMQKKGQSCLPELSAEEIKKKVSWFDSFRNEKNYLGGGNFGSVYKMKYQDNPLLYGALKVMEGEEDERQTMLNEICINKFLEKSQNVVKYLDGLIIDLPKDQNGIRKVRAYILLELGDKSLKSEIDQPTELTDSQEKILSIYKDILNGIREINAKGIVQNDMFAKNIILFNNRAKLADFGVSELSYEGEALYSKSKNDGKKLNLADHGLAGIESSGISQFVDLKKASVILYRMLFQRSFAADKISNDFLLPSGTDENIVLIFLKSQLSSGKQDPTPSEMILLVENFLKAKNSKVLMSPVKFSPKQKLPDLQDFKWKTVAKPVSLEVLRDGFDQDFKEPETEVVREKKFVRKPENKRPVLLLKEKKVEEGDKAKFNLI